MSTCKESQCEAAGVRVVEYYVTMNHRRVRLWVCPLHFLRGQYWRNGGPVEVPLPPHVKSAEDAEWEHMRKAEYLSRVTPFDYDKRSVHVLRSAGWGEALPNDRVANWRWE